MINHAVKHWDRCLTLSLYLCVNSQIYLYFVLDSNRISQPRKDFLDKEEAANAHPQRKYYYRKVSDADSLIEACTRKVSHITTNLYFLFLERNLNNANGC